MDAINIHHVSFAKYGGKQASYWKSIVMTNSINWQWLLLHSDVSQSS
jgi:hypothetical protein